MKDIKDMTPEELDAYRFEHRFDEAEAVMGKTATDAMRRLYDFYGKEWLDWLASLYDPKTGGFYFNDSARDNAQFLPDVESTGQALNLIAFAGALDFYGGSSTKAFPRIMQQRCVKFVQDMQSCEDGYFYHKQWGTDINYNRRNRDFNSSMSILRRFGALPLYPTATERISKDTASGGESVMPPHLLSRDAMLEFLDSLDINHNSYRMGHALSSQNTQIAAAGLSELVCDYINSHQYPDNGLWEREANYNTISGVIKLGATLSGLGSYVHYPDKLIDTVMDVIASDENPEFVYYVFNPWGAFSSVLRGAEIEEQAALSRGETPTVTVSDVRRMIYARLPELIDKTIEKFAKFKKPGGTFSHYQDRSTPTAQGHPVSLGGYEGDVNGLACAMHYPLSGIFGVLGISKIPQISNVDFRRFCEKIENLHIAIGDL